MEASLFVALVGILIRLAVPLAITALIVYALGKLDARWQAEAELVNSKLVNGKLGKAESPCWKETQIFTAPGEQPCWQTRRQANGYLREACLTCEIFRDAPNPSARRRAYAHHYK